MSRLSGSGVARTVPLLTAIIFAVVVMFALTFPLPGNADVNVRSVGGVHVVAKKVYKKGFQRKQHKKVKKLKKSRSWSAKRPLVIANPYGTCNTGLYVYFKTKRRLRVTYTVSCEGFPDFTRTVKTGSRTRTKKHEWLLMGCVQGHRNTVRIESATAAGKVVKRCRFTYWAPVRINARSVTSAIVNTVDTSRLTNGLYAVFGSTQVQQEAIPTYQHPSVALYDNSGTLRAEMPVVSYWPAGFLAKKHRLLFAVSHRKIVRMNATGRISKIYKLPKLYKYHHAYCFGRQGDLLLLGMMGGENPPSTEDLVLSLNLSSGKTTYLIDMRTLLSSYYWDRRARYATTEPMDWLHLNSLAFIGDSDKLLLSSRETSTVIAVGNVYDRTERKIDYLIGSREFWRRTGYEDKLLSHRYGFSLQAGQHAITYDGPVQSGFASYYVSMFDNSYLFSRTRSEYSWEADPEYGRCVFDRWDTSMPSRYYRYRVSPVLGSFDLVRSFDVPQSHYVSSTQNFGGNLVIGSGESNTVLEYTQDGELLQSMVFANNALRFYRALKYDFENFCFA